MQSRPFSSTVYPRCVKAPTKVQKKKIENGKKSAAVSSRTVAVAAVVKKFEAIFIFEYFYLFLSFFKSLNSIFLSLDNLLGPTWTSRQERIPRKSTLINRIVCFYHFIFLKNLF
jgi:hypothetical protein